MPGFDGTGPLGQGPLTGRGRGYCIKPGYMNSYGGRFAGVGGAFRGGFGRGRGYRNWYYATGAPGGVRYNMGYPAWGGVTNYPFAPDLEPEQEKEMLKSQSEALQKQLEEIKARMDELSVEQKEK